MEDTKGELVKEAGHLGGGMVKIEREHEEPFMLNVASLRQIHLDGISFHRCFLNDLDFGGSVLTDIDFRSAKLNHAKFASALFERCCLIMAESRAACYEACVFQDTLLFYSDFSGSSFRGADLSGGIIKEAIFRNCDLRGADMSCEGLETCSFEGAIYDDWTIWHNSFHATQSGALKEESGIRVY